MVSLLKIASFYPPRVHILYTQKSISVMTRHFGNLFPSSPITLWVNIVNVIIWMEELLKWDSDTWDKFKLYGWCGNTTSHQMPWKHNHPGVLHCALFHFSSYPLLYSHAVDNRIPQLRMSPLLFFKVSSFIGPEFRDPFLTLFSLYPPLLLPFFALFFPPPFSSFFGLL